MASMTLSPGAGVLVAGALALVVASMSVWTVEGRLEDASCSYESVDDEWTPHVTLVVRPRAGRRPLSFKTDAALGSCDWNGHGGRLAPAWAHFARDAPIRITVWSFQDPQAAPTAGPAMLLPRLQLVSRIEVNGRVVKRNWWDGA